MKNQELLKFEDETNNQQLVKENTQRSNFIVNMYA